MLVLGLLLLLLVEFELFKRQILGQMDNFNSSPATDGDFIDSIVSVPLVHCSYFGVVLSTQMHPDLGGVHHLLQCRRVVEVIIAWPRVWLWGQ